MFKPKRRFRVPCDETVKELRVKVAYRWYLQGETEKMKQTLLPLFESKTREETGMIEFLIDFASISAIIAALVVLYVIW